MKKIILFLTVILTLLAMCGCAATPMSFLSSGSYKSDDYTDSYKSDDYTDSYESNDYTDSYESDAYDDSNETAEEQIGVLAEINPAMEGWWQVESGGDFHTICIDSDSGCLTMQDGTDTESMSYTIASYTEIHVEFDGELFSFVFENGKLVRYENGVADGYVYEWIGSL